MFANQTAVGTIFGRQKIPIRSVIKGVFIIACGEQKVCLDLLFAASFDFATLEKCVDTPLRGIVA